MKKTTRKSTEKLTTPRTSLGKPPTNNVRHDIDPTLVKEQIEKKISDRKCFGKILIQRNEESLEKYKQAIIDGSTNNWVSAPKSSNSIASRTKAQLVNELHYYSTVRVIELPTKGKRFILVYGDDDDATTTEGTGPFESFQAAANWFLRGGR